MTFNEFVNQRRKELNMSVDDLVEKSKVPKSTVSKITAGINVNPTLNTVELLCKALECSLNDAVGYVEKNTVTIKEMAHIKKYRVLDEHGKDMVDTVLNKEHERILSYEAEETPEEYFVKYYDMPASAGTGVQLDDEPYQYLKVPETPTTLRADFAIRVSGDSMEPKYYDGDILLVESAIDIEIGEIGIFVLNGAGYVKKKGRKGLISLNENYNDIDVKEYDNCKCVGKVIGKL